MKKKYNYLRLCVVALSLLFVQNTQAQTVVNSLSELLPYLDDDNVNVKLAPGTYDIGFSEVYFGAFKGKNPLLLFEGSNSTYDFTDVKINFNTIIFQAFGSVDVNEIQILGNNNILKNLTMEDIGTLAPKSRAQAIVMDGRDNRIEGFHLTIRGSYPYGYGDAFGKGGNSVINHNKHSGILIRGLRNHLKNTTLISRSYGHCVFMQAASYPTIEGCYIEGEMRSTDDMLAEEGTGSPADNVDFMTVWGYKLPTGYMMSLQEAGIRAYNAGTTYIDGVEIERGTDNPTVLNCTIKNARTGVTLAHATGTKYVEGCTVLGSENGYSIGSGTVVNCGADAIYGPVFKNTYGSDNGYNADITILPPSDAYYNGHDAVAYIGGRNHNLTFRSEIPEDEIPANLKVMVSGDLQGLRVLNGSNPSQNNFAGTDIEVNNLTKFPMVLHSDSSNITGRSCGEITDNGTNNDIKDCGDNYNFPNPNVTYYFNNPRSNFRLASNGGEDVNLLDETSTGANTEWKITPSGETGYYFIDCVGGGVNPRIASDGTVYPDMDPVTLNEERSRWRFDEYSFGFYHITAENDDRLNVNNNQLEIVDSSNTGFTTLFSFSLASTLSSQTNTLQESIAIFPNPTSSFFKVKLKNNNSAKVDIVNLSGQVVLSKQIESNNNQIDLTNVSAGIYIAKIVSGDQVYTRKVVKQ